MAVDAHSLRGPLEDAMELVAINDRLQRRVLRLVTCELRDVMALVREHNERSRAVAERLDELARAAQHAEHNPQTANPLAVMAIVRGLRPVLRVLRDPAAHTAAQYVTAARDLRSIAAQVPRHKLMSKSVRHNLGNEQHDQLIALLDGNGPELITYLLAEDDGTAA